MQCPQLRHSAGGYCSGHLVNKGKGKQKNHVKRKTSTVTTEQEKRSKPEERPEKKTIIIPQKQLLQNYKAQKCNRIRQSDFTHSNLVFFLLFINCINE